MINRILIKNLVEDKKDHDFNSTFCFPKQSEDSNRDENIVICAPLDWLRGTVIIQYDSTSD